MWARRALFKRRSARGGPESSDGARPARGGSLFRAIPAGRAQLTLVVTGAERSSIAGLATVFRLALLAGAECSQRTFLACRWLGCGAGGAPVTYATCSARSLSLLCVGSIPTRFACSLRGLLCFEICGRSWGTACARDKTSGRPLPSGAKSDTQ